MGEVIKAIIGKLYVVGTPIGNLGDLSRRAEETLICVDFIAAEDSRITRKLLSFLNIRKAIISYHEHNKEERSKLISEKILNGESCALVSDAGMPCISDPGEYLVQFCYDLGIPTVVIPGPCAISSALSLAGTFGGKFSFYGFLSINKKIRNKTLAEIKSDPKTIVLYEAPHKLYRTLCDLYEHLENRKIVLVKELTKMHESADHTTLSKAVIDYKDLSIKGEYVIIIKPTENNRSENAVNMEQGICVYKNHIEAGKSKTEAIKLASKETGIKKNALYKEIFCNKLNTSNVVQCDK